MNNLAKWQEMIVFKLMSISHLNTLRGKKMCRFIICSSQESLCLYNNSSKDWIFIYSLSYWYKKTNQQISHCTYLWQRLMTSSDILPQIKILNHNVNNWISEKKIIKQLGRSKRSQRQKDSETHNISQWNYETNDKVNIHKVISQHFITWIYIYWKNTSITLEEYFICESQ